MDTSVVHNLAIVGIIGILPQKFLWHTLFLGYVSGFCLQGAMLRDEAMFWAKVRLAVCYKTAGSPRSVFLPVLQPTVYAGAMWVLCVAPMGL